MGDPPPCSAVLAKRFVRVKRVIQHTPVRTKRLVENISYNYKTSIPHWNTRFVFKSIIKSWCFLKLRSNAQNLHSLAPAFQVLYNFHPASVTFAVRFLIHVRP